MRQIHIGHPPVILQIPQYSSVDPVELNATRQNTVSCNFGNYLTKTDARATRVARFIGLNRGEMA
jgi:hypothetical protein